MTICFKYPIPPVESPPLNVSLPTSVPTLVVGGTKDGSTPFVWSQRISQRIAARLLVREGYGHVSYDKSRCAQQAMDLSPDGSRAAAGRYGMSDGPDLYPPAGPILPPLE